MNDLNWVQVIAKTLSGFTAMSHWEFIAVGLSMAYIFLAIKENLWCWPAAFLSTLIYTVLFFNGALLMESLLNFYYMFMAVYGWYAWHKHTRKQGSDIKVEMAITSWQLQRHFKIILITTLISIIIGYIMSNYTYADFAYLDSFTTCFAVVTTYLVTQKVLENWLYWIVIDGASIYLYVEKGYYPTVVLFVCYTVMAAWGFSTWYQEYEKNKIDERDNQDMKNAI
jgi:nicotinamide mononucleotide transporter